MFDIAFLFSVNFNSSMINIWKPVLWTFIFNWHLIQFFNFKVAILIRYQISSSFNTFEKSQMNIKCELWFNLIFEILTINTCFMQTSWWFRLTLISSMSLIFWFIIIIRQRKNTIAINNFEKRQSFLYNSQVIVCKYQRISFERKHSKFWELH